MMGSREPKGSCRWEGSKLLLTCFFSPRSQVGLGVLSLPSTLNVLGIVPGLITFLVLGLITSYGDFGTF